MDRAAGGLEKKAAAFIREKGLLEKGDTVLCALSGGPDSVALFHLLRALAPALGLSLRAVHLNHGLRGAGADGDETFVRALCAAWGVPLTVERAGMARRAAPRGESVETFARNLRYDFFERAARAEEAAGGPGGPPVKVATAHTAGDNAETLLFRLVRGSALAGAGGIPPRRGRYIRPLLTCTRREVLAYCAAGGFGWRQDETNLQPFCSRNRLRLQVMPVLRQLNPAAEENLAAFALQAREDAAFIDSLAKDLLAGAARGAGFDAARLAAAPGPVQRAAFAGLLAPLGLFGRGKVAACAAVAAGARRSAQLSGRVTARRAGGVFYLEQAERGPAAGPGGGLQGWEAPFSTGEFRLPDGRLLRVRRAEYEEFVKVCAGQKKELKNIADYGMINNIVPTFRTRRPGDTFRPARRGGTRPLKKLLAEAGVPLAARDRLLLLAAGSRVVWAQGFGVCEELLAGPGCPQAVWFTLQEPEE